MGTGPKIKAPVEPAGPLKIGDITTKLAMKLKAPKALKDNLLATGSDSASIFLKSFIKKTPGNNDG